MGRRAEGEGTFPTLGEVVVGSDILFTGWMPGSRMHVGPTGFHFPPASLIIAAITQLQFNSWRHWDTTSTAAAITSGNAETYAFSDGETLLVAVDGGGAQTATFNTGDFADIANATAAEVAAVITTDISGASAADVGGSVVITSATTGVTSEIEVTGGTESALGFASGAINGLDDRTAHLPRANPVAGDLVTISNATGPNNVLLETFGGAAAGNVRNTAGADDTIDFPTVPSGMTATYRCDGGGGVGQGVGRWTRVGYATAASAAYTRNATVVEDRTLLASASATAINNNNVLAALIADLQVRSLLG